MQHSRKTRKVTYRTWKSELGSSYRRKTPAGEHTPRTDIADSSRTRASHIPVASRCSRSVCSQSSNSPRPSQRCQDQVYLWVWRFSLYPKPWLRLQVQSVYQTVSSREAPEWHKSIRALANQRAEDIPIAYMSVSCVGVHLPSLHMGGTRALVP